MSNDQVYLDTLRNVLENGYDRPDRTGTGVKGLFGAISRYDLSTFPLLTSKKLEFKAILSELLWFIEGSGDERRLAELRYGKTRGELTGKRTIWTDNAQAPYWKDKAKFEGDLGRVYGVQWRKWKTSRHFSDYSEMMKFISEKNASYASSPGTLNGGTVFYEVDQLKNLIDGLKNDPFGRRHIITAWNPGELEEMALPPCHVMAQFYVSSGTLSCMLTQRSNDIFLGSPYNIASYSLLTYMIAQVTGYKPGEFVYSQGDLHIYHNHIEAAKEQLSREPRPAPFLYMDPTIKNIDDFRMEHFEVMGYDPHPVIKAKMAV